MLAFQALTAAAGAFIAVLRVSRFFPRLITALRGIDPVGSLEFSGSQLVGWQSSDGIADVRPVRCRGRLHFDDS